MGLLATGYGLFLIEVFFFDFGATACWQRLVVPCGVASVEELLRFARRFIHDEKGRRRECLSAASQRQSSIEKQGIDREDELLLR